jgi:hypothetical protein
MCRRSRLVLLLMPAIAAWSGCGAKPAPQPTCTELFSSGAAPTTAADLQEILDAARSRFYPNLNGVEIDLVADSSQYFFATNLDLNTLENAPRDRHYQVHYNPALLMNPPSRFAVGAILVHEVKHAQDYVGMTSDQLAEFGIWYASSNVDDYEHQTDLQSLEDGCGVGLKAFRIWLYANVPPALVAAKEEEYYTPAQIDAWIAANPGVH